MGTADSVLMDMILQSSQPGIWEWIYDSRDAALPVIVTVVGTYLVLGLCTRFGRLRSLSQMSGFDFGVNVAIGSIIAAVVLSPDPSLARASIALVTIFALQVIWSKIRQILPTHSNPSSQSPHVVWAGGFRDEALKATLFTRSDIYQAMRMAGVRQEAEVDFVVAEPTGALTVFKSSDTPPSRRLFDPVKGMETLYD